MTFQEHISIIRKGARNTSLVKLMLQGLGETNDDAQRVVDDIRSAWPDMTENEIRHALATAQSTRDRDRGKKISVGHVRISKAVTMADIVPQKDKDFVKDTISQSGKTTSKDIMAMSPIDVSKATPREQAMAYCATVFPDDRHYVFTATEESKFHKRTFYTLRFPSVLFRNLADGGIIPNYAIANQFKGHPDDYENAISGDDFNTFRHTGEGSFACMKTLATRRLALLEFDELPLDDQARFWATAIREDLFNGRLRTLVFSGTKSIHALIRVDSAEISGFHEEWYNDESGEPLGFNLKEEWSDDPESKWKIERRKLSRITEFSEDPKYRADRACKDPTRLTRFAGATRICKDGRRRIQRLLWCAEPKNADIPTLDCMGMVPFHTEGYGLNGGYYKC